MSQDLPPHEKERYEQLAREHRDKNKRVADDTRRDNCGNIIAVCLSKSLSSFYFVCLSNIS